MRVVVFSESVELGNSKPDFNLLLRGQGGDPGRADDAAFYRLIEARRAYGAAKLIIEDRDTLCCGVQGLFSVGFGFSDEPLPVGETGG